MLTGQVLEPANLPHHHQDVRQLAADAARQRYGRSPPEEEEGIAPQPVGQVGYRRRRTGYRRRRGS